MDSKKLDVRYEKFAELLNQNCYLLWSFFFFSPLQSFHNALHKSNVFVWMRKKKAELWLTTIYLLAKGSIITALFDCNAHFSFLLKWIGWVLIFTQMNSTTNHFKHILISWSSGQAWGAALNQPLYKTTLGLYQKQDDLMFGLRLKTILFHFLMEHLENGQINQLNTAGLSSIILENWTWKRTCCSTAWTKKPIRFSSNAQKCKQTRSFE